MILPSRRWFAGAALLALLAPLALRLPAVSAVLFGADVVWVLLFLLDGWRGAEIELAGFPLQREAPPAFSVGRPLPVEYRWSNPAGRPLLLRVREAVPAPLEAPVRERELALATGTVTREVLRFVPVRRGKATGGTLFLRVLGPLGLSWRQGRRPLPWSVTVYPDLQAAALRALPAQAQRRREAGFRSLRRLGEGKSFESLKEWVPGEETRSIDWKATARRGKLMARQYEDERRQRVMLLLDAGRLLTAESEAMGGAARLEVAVGAALELAHSAVAHDDDVGLLVFADEVLNFVPPTRGRRALKQVVDTLAGVEGRVVEPNYPAAFGFLAARSRKRALTVLFTDVIDRTASEALVAQAGSLRPRHLPLVVTLRDPALERLAVARPESEDAAFERAAAEELLEAREAGLAELRARGVLVLDVPPENAARAVVAQYEHLKRRGSV